MNKKLSRLMSVFLAIVSFAATADQFTDYVSACKSELGFVSIPQFSCGDILFRGPPASGQFVSSLDYVAHSTVNGKVDAVFACRWVRSPSFPLIADSSTAASAEMLVHNRTNGKTCFFQLPNVGTPGSPHVTTINPPSPTDANAAAFWDTPTNTAKTQCTRCHSAGPYIVSSPIAPAMAKFGLINDGHDIKGTDPANHYSAVGSFGPAFNDLAAQHRHPLSLTCASQCHLLGGITPTGTPESSITDRAGIIVIPSINIAIDELTGVANPNQFATLESMPPTDPYSDYRWLNMNSPLDNPVGDFEMLFDVQGRYPRFYCSNPPTSLSAHVVGSDEIISTNSVPDKLNRFNLQDGLVCLNSDQPGGQRCQDYQTRYMCNGKFTAFQSQDDPSYSGDWETRNGFKNLCASPTWIQARYKSGGVWVYVNGPADRLAQFDTNGLICLNSDQNNGQCSNYVVRFECL